MVEICMHRPLGNEAVGFGACSLKWPLSGPGMDPRCCSQH